MGSNHYDIAQRWAAGKSKQGAGKRMYFIGPTIYSYGSHYVAGHLLQCGTALINKKKYSNSTSSHVSYVESASRSRKQVWVNDLTKLMHLLRRAGDNAKAAAQYCVDERDANADLLSLFMPAWRVQRAIRSVHAAMRRDEMSRRRRAEALDRARFRQVLALPAPTHDDPLLDRKLAGIRAAHRYACKRCAPRTRRRVWNKVKAATAAKAVRTFLEMASAT